MLKIIGSHNSMSYLPVKNKWLKLVNKLFAQCQNKDIDDQIDAGVRCFDLRVYLDKDKHWKFAHGLINYDGDDIDAVVSHLSFVIKDKCYVRIILEKEYNNDDSIEFQKLCTYLEHTYDNIIFIGGYRKKDWKLLYDFNNYVFDITQYVGSMASDAKWYEKFMPFMYAKRCNHINKLNLKQGINLFDFI